MPLNLSAAFGSVEQTRHVGSRLPFSVSTNPSTALATAAHTKQTHFIQNKSHYHRYKLMVGSVFQCLLLHTHTHTHIVRIAIELSFVRMIVNVDCRIVSLGEHRLVFY